MTQDRRWLLLAALLPFVGFWAHGLFDLDEGFYGAVVVDMLRRGDWITPTYNGVPWFEKPILAYWMAMPTVALFGNEFGARLPSFLCTIGTVWAWHVFARRHRPDAAVALPLAYAGSFLVAGLGRMMMTDSALVLFLTLAFHALYASLVDGRSKHWVGAWLGLAVLAKGPVALVLFTGVCLALAWRAPEWRPVLSRGWGLALVILVLLVSLWSVPCYVANRDVFVQEFLVKQNLGRFAGGDRAHATPLWSAPFYFPLVLVLALLPLSASALRGTMSGLGEEWRSRTPSLRTFLWAWALVVLVFFSISGTKLPHYILPAVGPFCALLCFSVAEQARRWEVTLALWCATVGAMSLGVFLMLDRSQAAPVRAVAREAARLGEEVAVFGLSGPRPQGASLALTQQSSPSIGFYIRRPFREVETIGELAAGGFRGLVITRQGRIGGSELIEAYLGGTRLTQIEPRGGPIQLWRVEPQGAK